MGTFSMLKNAKARGLQGASSARAHTFSIIKTHFTYPRQQQRWCPRVIKIRANYKIRQTQESYSFQGLYQRCLISPKIQPQNTPIQARVFRVFSYRKYRASRIYIYKVKNHLKKILFQAAPIYYKDMILTQETRENKQQTIFQTQKKHQQRNKIDRKQVLGKRFRSYRKTLIDYLKNYQTNHLSKYIKIQNNEKVNMV